MTPVMYIPASVKEVGNFAFYSCSNLQEFHMGAQSEEQINFGDGWLPKNIKKVVVNVATKEQYGKTRDDASQRINELLEKGGEN
jgi:hypothetical protein